VLEGVVSKLASGDSTYLDVPLRSLQQRDGVLDILVRHLRVLLKSFLLTRRQLRQVEISVARHRGSSSVVMK
jgi:hypothetical protein